MPLDDNQLDSAGLRLSQVMEDKGVGASELERLTGLSKSAIYRLRHKTKCGNVYTWSLIADALNVSLDFLVRGIDEKEKAR